MSQLRHKQPVFKARELSELRRGGAHRADFNRLSEGAHLPGVGEMVRGRYLIERMIGKGQFGWVFLVRHIWLNRTFAMKVMHPRVASEPSWVERFRQEARQTSALGHEHIVFVTDFDRCEELGYFFVMEYVEGVTLSEMIKRDGAMMDPERALTLILQACDGLAAVHELGVVHRDLKPSNVMVCQRDGEECVKLLDFGIASSVFEVRASSKLYGTPAYMAPEQTITMDVDARADQFALATILYQMLTGKRPWTTRRWADASKEVRGAQRVEQVSAQREHVLLTAELDAVLARALSLEASERWEGMEAFGHALRLASGLQPCVYNATQAPKGLCGELSSAAVLSEQPSMVMLVEQDSCAWQLGAQAHSVACALKSTSSAAEAITGGEGDGAVRLSALTFRTNERLLRAWRSPEERLSQGAITLRAPRACEPGERVRVQLVVEQEQWVMELHGAVCSSVEALDGPQRRDGVTRQVRHAVCVEIDALPLKRLAELVGMLSNEERLACVRPQSTVRITRAMSAQDELSTGEAFMISRLDHPAEVQTLRRLFGGLSFAFDEVLMKLIRKGFVQIEAPAPQAASATRPSAGHAMYNSAQIAHVLELVAFFKRTHNEQAAIAALKRAIVISPTQGEFYHQLALLYARDHHAPRRAVRAIDTALQLCPARPEFLRTREYIHTLYRRRKEVARQGA